MAVAVWNQEPDAAALLEARLALGLRPLRGRFYDPAAGELWC
jgi:hypothetical protein